MSIRFAVLRDGFSIYTQLIRTALHRLSPALTFSFIIILIIIVAVFLSEICLIILLDFLFGRHMNTAELGRFLVQQDNVDGIEERFEREVLGRLFLFFLGSSSRF